MDSTQNTDGNITDPGTAYTNPPADVYRPFSSSETILTSIYTNKEGRYVSILVPIIDANQQTVIAVLGIDMPAYAWYHNAITGTLQIIVIISCLLAIYIGFYIIVKKNQQLQNDHDRLLESENRMRVNEQLLRTIFEQSPIGIAVINGDQYITSINADIPSTNSSFIRITGRTSEELTRTPWESVTHPDDIKKDQLLFNRFKAGLISNYDLEKRYLLPDGHYVWVHLSVAQLYNEQNKRSPYHICLIEDIDKRKRIESELYDSERSKAVFLDNLPGMAYRCKYDRDWTMEFVSKGCYNLTGYQADSVINNKELSYNSIIDSKYQSYIWDRWGTAIATHDQFVEEYEIITADKGKKWVLEQGQAVYNDQGNVIALEGIILDITSRKVQEMKLKYINTHDELTGLYNLNYFSEILRQEKNNTKNRKRAVCLLNLRKFSVINLSYGFSFGDRLIRNLTSEMMKICTDNILLFRLSTDRYLFYVNQYIAKYDLEKLCNEVIEILNRIISFNYIMGSIGIVELEKDNFDADYIIKLASIAAENTPNDMIHGYFFFDKKMEEKVERTNHIRNELSEAIINNEGIYMVYQPIYNVKANGIEGFEALARFESRVLGSISPNEFIPIAESTQLIVPLGRILMRTVFELSTRLEKLNYPGVVISFNMSMIHLLRSDFCVELESLLRETEVKPSNLVMEITESVFMDNYQEINEKLCDIQKLGIKIAIDDFGTGYSSLSREKDMSINYLKIDKHFADKLMDDNPDQVIMSDIISMGHKLGHFVVAEGIEYEKQKDYLIKNGCDYIQGYLISKPISENELLMMLKKVKHKKVG